MNRFSKAILMALLMLGASLVAMRITPTQKLANTSEGWTLENILPLQFGQWRIDQTAVSQIVNPDAQRVINEIYNQTLNRVYVNATGERMMLSIAYAQDNLDMTQVHQPEVCYPAQGFEIESSGTASIETSFGTIPVVRLETRQYQRFEPVTYWIKVGQKIVSGTLASKWAQISYGLQGKIPDGMLFRVSSIDRNSAHAFELQAGFIRQLMDASNAATRQRLMAMQ